MRVLFQVDSRIFLLRYVDVIFYTTVILHRCRIVAERIHLAVCTAEIYVVSGELVVGTQHLHQLSELGVNLKSSIEMDEAGAIKRAVEEGAGLAILSRSVVERELIEGRLIELQLDHQILKRSILMLWRPNSQELPKFFNKNQALA